MVFINCGEVTLSPDQVFNRRHADVLEKTNQRDVFLLKKSLCLKKGEKFGWTEPLPKGLLSVVSELSEDEGLAYLASIDEQYKAKEPAKESVKELAKKQKA